jgi:ribosomal protein L15E
MKTTSTLTDHRRPPPPPSPGPVRLPHPWPSSARKSTVQGRHNATEVDGFLWPVVFGQQREELPVAARHFRLRDFELGTGAYQGLCVLPLQVRRGADVARRLQHERGRPLRRRLFNLSKARREIYVFEGKE